MVVEAREMVRRFECLVSRCSVLRGCCIIIVCAICRVVLLSFSQCAVNHLTGRLLKISSTHLFPFSVLKLPSQLE